MFKLYNTTLGLNYKPNKGRTYVLIKGPERTVLCHQHFLTVYLQHVSRDNYCDKELIRRQDLTYHSLVLVYLFIINYSYYITSIIGSYSINAGFKVILV